ncbi:MAG: response regulator transcription factor [Anaerolineae bacterium]|jgi:DNA-binding response OmpR family regulator
MERNPWARVLLVDNSADYRHSLLGLLGLEDYAVEEAGSVTEAKEKLLERGFDLALVDLRLTDDEDEYDFSGLEVARLATERGVPCVMITAFPSFEATRLALRSRGFEPLAVDLIRKKDGPQSILDTIKLVLRRHEEQIRARRRGLQIDLERGLVWLDGEELDLSRNQYDLLAYLYEQDGAVCSPEDLLMAVYEEQVPPDQASADKRLESLVDRLRKKIEQDPSDPRHLIKVYGRGFRLDMD